MPGFCVAGLGPMGRGMRGLFMRTRRAAIGECGKFIGRTPGRRRSASRSRPHSFAVSCCTRCSRS